MKKGHSRDYTKVNYSAICDYGDEYISEIADLLKQARRDGVNRTTLKSCVAELETVRNRMHESIYGY